MLPCRRGAHVPVSQRYPKMSKQIIKMMLKSILKASTIHQNWILIMMLQNIQNYQQTYYNCSCLESHLGSSCISICRCGTSSLFFCDLVFATSARHPLERVGPPLGYPWSAVLHSWNEFNRNVAPNVRDCRAAFRYFVNKGHQRRLQKTSKNSKLHSSSIRTNVFYFLLF